MFFTLPKSVPFRGRAFPILPLVLGLVFALLVDFYSPAVGQKSTELLWDTYGVPHIYSRDAKSLFQTFGWAQMQSHGNLLLRLYGQAQGRAAEYWGEKYLESDRWVRTMGVPVRARQWYEAQSPTFRSYLDAFAVGINTYVQEHADLIDDKVEAVLPVSGVDVLAHTQRVLHFTFVVNPDRVAGVIKGNGERATGNSVGMARGFDPDPNKPSIKVGASHSQWLGKIQTGNDERFVLPRSPFPVSCFPLCDQQHAAGSNAWAIAPKHSANRNAMLLANPHTPWSDLFLWYEAQLTAPGIDAYGATLVGIPVLAIAFNDRLGWTHTINTHQGWNAYELTLADGGYAFDGRVRGFETETQTLKVKQDDGILLKEKLVVQRSIHGSIVQQKDNKAIALRVVGLDQPGVLEEWWNMARAKNLAEFEDALESLQLPMFTVMYADRDGHIMHLFNGQVPVRSEGDFKSWSGLIPGDTSATLWTKTHPYHDLPRVVDPPSGWLQNANDPPWTTTFPIALNPDDYPPYMAPRGSMDFRAQRSARMLAEQEQISFKQMVEYKHSTRMEMADRLLDDLIPPAQQQGSEIARRAALVLDAWDRKADADSRGAVLFASWVKEMDFPRAFTTQWNEKSPRTTPNGLVNLKSAVVALESAATKVEATYGELDVRWGDVFRLRYGNIDLPANGGSGSLGIFRALSFVPDENGRFRATGGDSYTALIEFSNPVRAMALTSYGNATQPGSPHMGNQLQLFAQHTLRPVWRERKDIVAHLTLRQIF